MSQQLRRGARQSLDYYNDQLDTIERRARVHQDFDTMAALANLVRLRDQDLEPMLMRAGPPEPTQDKRIRDLEAKVNDMAGMLATIMQMLGQTL